MSADNLPEESMIDILSRLQVKSVVRFKSVHET
ncbi:F-box protein [Corchorus olitorius]|uniref:F-box protein n=1 Tax=Corchorus olitorius TaxID=93759 RepID=A0A1R3JID3_9ROSI|nr:F-box protein [Corchorus olitorius]